MPTQIQIQVRLCITQSGNYSYKCVHHCESRTFMYIPSPQADVSIRIVAMDGHKIHVNTTICSCVHTKYTRESLNKKGRTNG